MLRLRGNVPAIVDDKGRLRVSNVFMADMKSFASSEGNDNFKFYITSMDGKSARFYPLCVWEAIEAKLAKIPGTNPVKRRFLEITAYYGAEVVLDAKGRFLIPQVLREIAELSGEVVILGQIDHLAIWNRHLFECRLAAEPFTANDLALLAELGV